MKQFAPLLLATFCALPALAADLLAENPAAIADAMLAAGYRAEMGTDGIGDPKISSAAGGVNYTLYFYGCEAGRNCTSVQFSAGFDLPSGTTLAIANAWNAEKRYSAAHLDDENDPYLRMDLYLAEGGLSPEAFGSILSIWDRQLSEFRARIGF
jgi:hypothetical protein